MCTDMCFGTYLPYNDALHRRQLCLLVGAIFITLSSSNTYIGVLALNVHVLRHKCAVVTAAAY